MAQHDDRVAEAQTRRAKERAKTRNVQIDSSIRKILSDSEGRRFLWWLLEIGRVNSQPFTTNAITTAFNCGELNVGNQVLARIVEVDPASYVRMQMEQIDDHRELGDTDGSAAASSYPGAYDAPGSGPDTSSD